MKIRRFEGAVRLSGAAVAVAAWSWRTISVSFAIIVCLSLSSQAGDDPLIVDAAGRVVVRFLQRHCLDCHERLSLEGDLDLQSRQVAFATREEIRFWTRVYDRADRGEMPPADCPHPPADEKQRMLQSLAADMSAAEAAFHFSEGRSAWLRLNRIEYENTIRDRLYVDIDVKETSPEDVTISFRNTISLDQFAVEKLAPDTRFPYLALGTQRGSLSFSRAGVQIPSEKSPSSLFRQLFVDGSPDEVRKQIQRLKEGQSICQIFVSMSQQLGVPAGRFASGDQPVAGLEPV